MTETQAKSGAVGTSAAPVDEEAAGGGAPATGRAAVGRAVVPADQPSPKFTRAPGMNPPPDEPPADGAAPAEPGRSPAARTTGTASVPVVKTKGKPAAPAAPAAKPAPAAPPTGGAAAPARPGTGTPVRGTPPAKAPARGPGAPTAAPAKSAAAAAAPSTATAPSTGTAAVGAARVSEAVRSARSTVTSAAARGPRRARLNLKRIDPWSVMKFSFAVSVVLFIVVIVATSVLYLALDAMGVWNTINTSLTEFVNASGGTQSAFTVTAWGVIGTSMLIGAVNVVLFTALATLGAFIYNVCADLVGGVELTLAERD